MSLNHQPDKSAIPFIVGILTLLCVGWMPTQAAEMGAETGKSEMEYFVRPYVWAAGLDGEVGTGDIRADIDVSFSDIMDTLELGGMLELEARRNRWGLIVDGLYLGVSEDQETPGPFFTVIEPTIKLGLIDVAVAYRVFENDRSWLDLMAGGRYVHMDVKLDLDPDYDAVNDISSEVVGRASDAIRDQVEGEVNRKAEGIAEELAAITGDISDEAEDRILEEIRDRVRENIEGILGNIDAVTPPPPGDTQVSLGGDRGTVGDIIKGKIQDRIDEQLQEIKDTIRDAVAEKVKDRVTEKLDEIAGNKDKIKNEIMNAAMAKIAELKKNASEATRKALEQAEKELASLVEEGMNEAASADINETREWVDPYVGFRAQHYITETCYLGARGDIGGFGVGSELTWQLFGGVGYAISRNVVVEGGWRYLAIDYDHDDLILDVAFSGATVGVGISF